MKIFIKLMTLALVLSYASLFIIKKPDGTPIKTLNSLNPDFDFSTMATTIKNIFPANNSNSVQDITTSTSGAAPDIESTPQALYRWQDEQGSWHYTNTPPPGVQAEAMDLQSPNVMTLYRADLPGSDEASEGREDNRENVTAGSTDRENGLPGVLPGRLGEMQETLQQAQEARDQFQQQLDDQQQILEAL